MNYIQPVAAEDEYECAYAARVRRQWSEEHGRIDFGRILGQVPVLSHLYVCGPSAFLESAVDAATTLGWPVERIHMESFALVRSFVP